MSIWSKDLLMYMKRNVRVTTIQLGQPDEKEDVEDISVTKPRSSRETTSKSNSKGKNVASSSKKAKKTKELLIGKD